MKKLYESAKRLGRGLLFVGGLATLLGGCSEYRGGGEYSCKRDILGGITAKRNNQEISFAYYEKTNSLRIFDSKNIPAEEIPSVISGCIRAFDE